MQDFFYNFKQIQEDSSFNYEEKDKEKDTSLLFFQKLNEAIADDSTPPSSSIKSKKFYEIQKLKDMHTKDPGFQKSQNGDNFKIKENIHETYDNLRLNSARFRRNTNGILAKKIDNLIEDLERKGNVKDSIVFDIYQKKMNPRKSSVKKKNPNMAYAPKLDDCDPDLVNLTRGTSTKSIVSPKFSVDFEGVFPMDSQYMFQFANNAPSDYTSRKIQTSDPNRNPRNKLTNIHGRPASNIAGTTKPKELFRGESAHRATEIKNEEEFATSNNNRSGVFRTDTDPQYLQHDDSLFNSVRDDKILWNVMRNSVKDSGQPMFDKKEHALYKYQTTKKAKEKERSEIDREKFVERPSKMMRRPLLGGDNNNNNNSNIKGDNNNTGNVKGGKDDKPKTPSRPVSRQVTTNLAKPKECKQLDLNRPDRLNDRDKNKYTDKLNDKDKDNFKDKDKLDNTKEKDKMRGSNNKMQESSNQNQMPSYNPSQCEADINNTQNQPEQEKEKNKVDLKEERMKLKSRNGDEKRRQKTLSPPKLASFLKRNEKQIEQIILRGKNICKHSSNMTEYLKRRGLKETAKVFCFNSQDDHIKRALKKFGWAENCLFSSVMFDLKWGYNDSENEYKNLLEGQLYNHFLNNQAITTKNGLNERLRNIIEHGVDIYDFFPRCFDMGNTNQVKELKEDHERTSLIVLIKRHWKYFKSRSEEKVNKAKERFQAKLLLKKDNLNQVKRKKKKKPYFYEEFVADQNFLVHIELVEIAINCVRSLVRQYKDLVEGDCHHSMWSLEKGHKANLLKYGAVTVPYHTLTKEEKKKFGGNSECWQTPNELLCYKLYKFKKLLKQYVYQYSIDGINNIWIIKPCGNARGSGIYLSDDLEEAVLNAVKNQARIVQKYIEKPFIIRDPGFNLLYNKKFDLRQWVLVTSIKPLKIYFFSSCYLRICSDDYDLSDIKDLHRHLTNFSLNKNNFKNNLDDSVCDLNTFTKYLKLTRGVDWDTSIKPKIHQIVINTLVSASDEIEHRDECFELYGFDIILDYKLKPWLLEVNLSPACSERTGWLMTMLDKMAEGLLKIVLPKEYIAIESNPVQQVEGENNNNNVSNNNGANNNTSNSNNNTNNNNNYSNTNSSNNNNNNSSEPTSVTPEYYESINNEGEFCWELIYENEEIKETGLIGVQIPVNLEIWGVKANLKKERELDRNYFAHIAIIKIQQYARGFICRRRLLRLRENKASIIIQKYARRFLAKRLLIYLRKCNAVRYIKDVLNINKAQKICFLKKQNKMATKIQSHIRMHKAKKLRAELYKLKCIIKIQSKWRSELAIKQKTNLRIRLRKIIHIQQWWKRAMKKRILALIKIQSLARMIIPKKKLNALRVVYTMVLKIQKFWRIARARILKNELKLNKLIAVFTRSQQKSQKKKFFLKLKIRTAIHIINKQINHSLATLAIKKIRSIATIRQKSAIKLQGIYKIIRAKRRLRVLRRRKMAIKIQSFIRMVIIRSKFKRYLKALKAATKIQHCVRRFLTKLRLKKIKHYADEKRLNWKKMEQEIKMQILQEEEQTMIKATRLYKKKEQGKKQQEHIKHLMDPTTKLKLTGMNATNGFFSTVTNKYPQTNEIVKEIVIKDRSQWSQTSVGSKEKTKPKVNKFMVISDIYGPEDPGLKVHLWSKRPSEKVKVGETEGYSLYDHFSKNSKY